MFPRRFFPADFYAPAYFPQSAGTATAVFRAGTHSRHGSLAEHNAAPGRPYGRTTVPARPTIDDRETPPNRPFVPE